MKPRPASYKDLAMVPTFEAQVTYLYAQLKDTGTMDCGVNPSLPNAMAVAVLRFKAWTAIRSIAKPEFAEVMKNGTVEERIRAIDKADRNEVTVDEITAGRDRHRQMIDHRTGV